MYKFAENHAVDTIFFYFLKRIFDTINQLKFKL
jgi:hypothetical protein